MWKISNMPINKATDADIPELNELVNITYRGKPSPMGWTTEADLLEGARIDQPMLKEQMDTENGAILKYTDPRTGRIIGAIYLETSGSSMYFGMLTVSPSAQGRGIGRALLEYSESYARKNNCTKLVATVIDVRSELIEWYIRFGFKRTGHIEPFPADGKVGIPKIPIQLIEIEKIVPVK